jgi:GTPase
MQQDRLEAWFDGSAICVIAVGAHGDPLDLAEHEVENFIETLKECLLQARGEKVNPNAS